MNFLACWNGCHEDCWDESCACICHMEGFGWKDADTRIFSDAHE